MPHRAANEVATSRDRDLVPKLACSASDLDRERFALITGASALALIGTTVPESEPVLRDHVYAEVRATLRDTYDEVVARYGVAARALRA